MLQPLPVLLFAVSATALAAEDPRWRARDAIFVSPDKRYEVKLHREPVGGRLSGCEFKFIERGSGRQMFGVYQSGTNQGPAFVVWSNDSRLVALYHELKLGHRPLAYRLVDNEFRALDIPDFDLPADKDSKRIIDYKISELDVPKKWTNNGSLIFQSDGKFQVKMKAEWISYSYHVQVDFDNEGKGKVVERIPTKIETINGGKRQ